MPVSLTNLILYEMSILIYAALFLFYYRIGEIERDGRLLIITGVCFIAGILTLNGVHQLIWALLVWQMYNDMTTHTVICLPTRLYMAACIIYMLVCRLSISNLLNTTITIVVVYILSVFRIYASGDAEIFVLLAVTAATTGENAIIYTMTLVYLSCIIFILELLAVNLVCLLCCFASIIKRRKRHYKIIRRAAMVPAIAFSYYFLWMMK